MTRLVDWHVHVLPPELRGVPSAAVLERETAPLRKAYRHPRVGEITHRASAEAVLEVMEDHGVDVSVVFGQQWRDPDLCSASNDYVVGAVASSLESLRGLLVVQPQDPASLEEVERLLDAPGILGVKVKPKWGGFSLADMAVMGPLCDLLESRGVLLLTHVSQAFHASAGDNAAELVTLVRERPGLRVVAAHLGGFVDVYSCHPPVGGLLDRVWLDVSLPSNLAWVPALMENGARDRYVYATDFPYGDPGQFLSQLREQTSRGEPVLDVLRRNGDRLLVTAEQRRGG